MAGHAVGAAKVHIGANSATRSWPNQGPLDTLPDKDRDYDYVVVRDYLAPLPTSAATPGHNVSTAAAVALYAVS